MAKYRKILKITFLLICVWIAITTLIYSFSNPGKTETERFLHIPKSFILNFE